MTASSYVESDGDGADDVPSTLGEATSSQETVESNEQVVDLEESKMDDGSLKLDDIPAKDEENALPNTHGSSTSSMEEKGTPRDPARVDYLTSGMLPATCKLDSNKLTFKRTRRPSLYRDNELADIIIDCDGEDLAGKFESENEGEGGEKNNTLRKIWDESRNNFGGVLLGSPFGKSLDMQKERKLRKMWENSRDTLNAFDLSMHSSSSSNTTKSSTSTMRMQKPKRLRFFGNPESNDNPAKKSFLDKTARKEMVIVFGVILMTLASVLFLFLFLAGGSEVVTEILKNS
mmetsp:Transcript_14055/g.21669  ORF Transcript_14055/g.21669 Transcript_14055/m.21669 type:complete len:289 (+) Transcript_14055:105-971(+)